MTAKNVAASLRMHAHSLLVAMNKIKESDELEYESLLALTLQLLQELANNKMSQAIMLENLSEHLTDVDFQVIKESEDLTPFGKPPINLD